MKKLLTLTVALGLLAGCATRADNITAAYVSPLGYEGLSCAQLGREAQAMSSHAAAATGAQNKKATGDAVAMTVGLVVFWPALFLTQGDGAAAAEVSRLKGEMQAIETVSRRKGCGIVFNKAG
jgi:hypothetical protein